MKGKNKMGLRDGQRQKLVLSPADKIGVAAAQAYALKARTNYTVQITGADVMQSQAVCPDVQTTPHSLGVMAGPMKKMPVIR